MTITLAVDAMGGDHGPSVTIPASINALSKYDQLHIILVGDQELIQTELQKNKYTNTRLSIQHASEVVEMDESPQSALKNKKDSSMRVAINLIKEEKAQACVSAGNTGALMATARYVLKMLPGIDRPAIASSLPSQKGTTYMLDLGANTDCTAENLLQFAVMGAMLVSSVTGNPKPSVGLLNIGSEDMKGNEVVRQAGELLRRSHLNFYGNVEGNDIFKGTTDVVVCDGFVGNVALKTAEGIAQLMGRFLTQEFKRNWITKSMAFVSLLVLNRFKKRLDPRRYNGASFLGLKGIVVKSHGGADSYSFFYAIRTAIEESKNNVLENIQKQLELEMPLDISSSENL
ncbi:phosphate acyltransferase PlsX [Candidatus Methylopumilus universalis]|jgi:glycerol-3-phosphate acyltransferase PlsX|uniref:Phosphate acyltransferase n=1 Tax=Candidatus Methylopumilus universalis TaxID=2588536 RepID=A0AAX1F046_9PROT|nr:phosphate acyltransferase PlsX [Candidatus Methylopumilus universalis]QDC41136.1 phosphate acyltransferase PlsX [Candidatus Methylopumilus universalis]QDC42426.1 phosphate acyltransferase PlsX [Candidatus Methylopumilus universalis]QDC54812.1 phosphate acyltransferase PlsX [Candidatus Methylopumilus universalis]QDC56093.1 phosphate acyltransferase PlsX [Candidatus Methylopumilus universalis]QDC57375.1 phosphate acyltransferase PlsX [Candidatus Methylopumilus universalis]